MTSSDTNGSFESFESTEPFLNGGSTVRTGPRNQIAISRFNAKMWSNTDIC